MTLGLLVLLALACSSGGCAVTSRSLEGDFKRNFLELPKFRF
jgi:hypothetical protein